MSPFYPNPREAGNTMQLYERPDCTEDAANNAAFLKTIAQFPNLKPFQPSPMKAPWHVQVCIDFGQYPIIINFWPHNLKTQRDGCKSVEGVNAMIGVIEGAIEDAIEDANIDMIERE